MIYKIGFNVLLIAANLHKKTGRAKKSVAKQAARPLSVSRGGICHLKYCKYYK
jgi:hypothetical protein